jgi:hypothetical protein
VIEECRNWVFLAFFLIKVIMDSRERLNVGVGIAD